MTKPAPLLASHHVKSRQIATFLHLRTTISPSATILFSTEVPMFKLRHSPLVLLALVLSLPVVAQEAIQIDAQAQTTPFPHFWEQMFGSGRAILTLRASYRADLRAVKKITDLRSVRLHAIL